ncbi:hypothetical protein PVK06_001657 [Gossypium arboreum]|uniref:Uncharacterized protein n=1 Tax=Gossypium arboreum TaxID=29729 RepID=A0ABR0R1R5_GOSAR|nr:hypothetical protein PVK06_001657 [Gossypium arboreum]
MELSMKAIENQGFLEKIGHHSDKILANNEDVNLSMVVNVKLIFAQVKGITRVTLNERLEKKYPLLDVDCPNMLDGILKAMLIQFPKMK